MKRSDLKQSETYVDAGYGKYQPRVRGGPGRRERLTPRHRHTTPDRRPAMNTPNRIQIGTVVITAPFTARDNDSETAAWYTDHEFQPQEVPLTAEIGPTGRVGATYYTLTGTVTDEYHAALWGGLPVGDSPYQPRGIGDTRTRTFRIDGYVLAKMFNEDRGEFSGGFGTGYIIPADGVTVSARTTEHGHHQHVLPANPVCDCGAPLRKATQEERDAARDIPGVRGMVDYMHTDGTACPSKHHPDAVKPRGYAWPDPSQWRTFTVPSVVYSLHYAPADVPADATV